MATLKSAELMRQNAEQMQTVEMGRIYVEDVAIKFSASEILSGPTASKASASCISIADLLQSFYLGNMLGEPATCCFFLVRAGRALDRQRFTRAPPPETASDS